MIRSIRTRLALWYALALALGLGATSGFVYAYLSRTTRARIDADLRNAAVAFAQLWRSAIERGASPPEEFFADARAENLEFVVFDESQREIASNSRAARLRRSRRAAAARIPRDSLLARPDLAALFRAAGAAGEAYQTLEGPLGRERAYAVAVGLPGHRQIVATIRGLEDEEHFLGRLRRAFQILIPIATGIALLGGAWLAGRALRPVGIMADQAGRIGAGTLHERIPAADPGDELGLLAAAFNRLLARLEAAFDQQRRFMAEASHELRTPIAVVRGEADLALSQPNRPEVKYREALAVIAAESRRLTQVVDDLFFLARADAGQLPIERGELDLTAVAAASCRALQTLATKRGITVAAIADAPLPIQGDAMLLRRLADNLIGNAIRYGRTGGRVTIRVARQGGMALLSVEDDGPGVPAEIRDRIFDRFYRGPDARTVGSEHGGGAGLGLAIARSIAESHGGTLVLERTGPDGSVFAVALPAPEHHRTI